MLIPEGKYLARAEGWDFGVSNKSTDFIAVSFRLEEGPCVGQTAVWHGYFTEKTEKRTVEALRYCGWTGDDLASLDCLDKNFVSVTIEHDTNEETGKTYARIAWVNKPGSFGVKNAMTADQRRVFAARMRGVVASVPKNLADAPAITPAAAPTNNGKPVPEPDPLAGMEPLPF